jgi:hypothetical protein
MSKGGKTQTVTTQNTQTPDPASQAYINQIRQRALGAANVALQGPGGAASPGGMGFMGGNLNSLLANGASGVAGGGTGGANGNSWFTGPITPEQITAAMNPYLSNVVDATKGQYDQLRSQAQLATDQQATQAGAFGGSRAAVTEGARLGQLDQGQAQTIAGLLQSGYGQAQQFAQSQQQLQQQQQLEPLFRQQQALGLMNLGLGPVGMNTTTATTQPRNGNAIGSAAGGALTGFAAGGTKYGIPGAIIGGIGGLLGGLF